VTVLEPDGHTRVENNRFLNPALLTPGPARRQEPANPLLSTEHAPLRVGGPLAVVATAAKGGRTSPPASGSDAPNTTTSTSTTPASGTTTTGTGTTTGKKTSPGLTKKAQQTVSVDLQKLARSGQISASAYRTYLGQWNSALKEEKQLDATRSEQLADVTVLIHNIAAAHYLTASRLPVLFLTLKNNATYWRSGAMLYYGARVQFPGSELVWEYYPGQGIQLQVLGTFGEADGYYESGKANYPKLVSLMQEMMPLAVQRGGGLAWEYYFDWEGGTPPWVSAMSQATGIEALTNAYLATGNRTYLTTAQRALPLLEAKPPTGVGVPTARGRQYLQYSFEPNNDIINAFLQTLIGLDDYAKVSGNATAKKLFAQGNAQAISVLGSFNTGAWSLYEPGEEDDLSYHELVTGFAQNLCKMTATPIYCTTATDFQADLKTDPIVAQTTYLAKPNRAFPLRFSLSKISKVGIEIYTSSRSYVETSAQYPHGSDYINVPKLKKGLYDVKLSATDLAGNYYSVSGELGVGVSAPKPPAPPVFPPPTVTIPTTTTPTPTPTTTTPTKTTTTPTTTPTETTTVTPTTITTPTPTVTTTTSGTSVSGLAPSTQTTPTTPTFSSVSPTTGGSGISGG
jgi:hypothetical protein